jgi:tetratricopeptide (TPR) repeat protein
LDAAIAAGMSAEARDDLAAELWEIALLIEQGDLDSARERLERAQDRLSEAMRNGADQSEIDELVQELREAMRDYMNQLAQEAQRDPDRQQALNEDSMEITGDQLADMLERLQQLMEEGRMDEAAELLEMLRQMMENMQIAEGEGGQGGPGQQAMEGLAETLRGQQGLNDDTFRDLQQQFGNGQPGGQGQGEGEGEGQEGQGGLSERQQSLRDQLGNQRGNIPGRGTPEGDAIDDALDRAEGAMEGAEQALREGDNAGALERQAEAMEALREGMRNLGEMMAEQQQQGNGQGEQVGRADPDQMRDPLGRESGAMGRMGTDENLMPGEDVYRRAQELLEELRRRSGDLERPDVELDYLRRLLDRF